MSADRRWERLKTLLLLVLVASSLWLSARLWLSGGVTGVEANAGAPYLAPGSKGELTWQELVRPRALVLALGGNRYALLEPDEELYPFLWQALVDVLAGTEWDPVQFETERVAALFRGEDGARGVEALLPANLDLGSWRSLWGSLAGQDDEAGEREPAADPAAQQGSGIVLETGPQPEWATGPLDRVAVLVSSNRVWILMRGAGGYVGQEVAPSGLTTTRAREAADRLARVLAAAPPLRLPQARPAAPTQGMQVAAGIWLTVPADQPVLLQLGPPALDWDALSRAFFPIQAGVRQVFNQDLRLFTDGVRSVSVRPDVGLVEFSAPAAMWLEEGQQPPDLLDALRQVVDFGNHHGGWPAEVELLSVETIQRRGSLQLGEKPRPSGYRFRFGLRLNGLPVAGATAVDARVGAGGVSYWSRRFVHNHLTDRFARELQPALTAMQRVGALPSEELPGTARRLREVQLVYAGDDQSFFKPAWSLRFQDGTRVLVDAWNVDLYRVIPPEA